MPTNTYQGNPQSPGYDWKPSGFLAGMMWQGDNARYQQAADMALKERNLGLLNDQLDWSNRQKINPSYVDSTIATNNAISDTIGRKKEADVVSQEQQNAINAPIAANANEAYNIKLQAAHTKQALDAIGSGLQIAGPLLNTMSQGPAGISMAREQFGKMNIDPQTRAVVNSVLNAQDPKAAYQHLVQQRMALDTQYQAALLSYQGRIKAAEIAAGATMASKKADEAMISTYTNYNTDVLHMSPVVAKAEAVTKFLTGRYGLGGGHLMPPNVQATLAAMKALIGTKSNLDLFIASQGDQAPKALKDMQKQLEGQLKALTDSLQSSVTQPPAGAQPTAGSQKPQSGKPIANPTPQQYKDLPPGAPYTWNGQPFNKGKK